MSPHLSILKAPLNCFPVSAAVHIIYAHVQKQLKNQAIPQLSKHSLRKSALLINIKTINISSPNTTEERYNRGLKSKEKRAVRGRRKRGMDENVKERWKRLDKANKGNTSGGSGWENKKKGVQRIKGRKVDWILLKLILIQQAASLPALQLEAAVASTII